MEVPGGRIPPDPGVRKSVRPRRDGEGPGHENGRGGRCSGSSRPSGLPCPADRVRMVLDCYEVPPDLVSMETASRSETLIFCPAGSTI